MSSMSTGKSLGYLMKDHAIWYLMLSSHDAHGGIYLQLSFNWSNFASVVISERSKFQASIGTVVLFMDILVVHQTNILCSSPWGPKTKLFLRVIRLYLTLKLYIFSENLMYLPGISLDGECGESCNGFSEASFGRTWTCMDVGIPHLI